MTKYQEIEHIQYITKFLEKLPPDITVYTLYLYLQGEEKSIKESITVKDRFIEYLGK